MRRTLGAVLLASAVVAATAAATTTTDWIWPSQDPDGTQEKLLNVSTF